MSRVNDADPKKYTSKAKSEIESHMFSHVAKTGGCVYVRLLQEQVEVYEAQRNWLGLIRGSEAYAERRLLKERKEGLLGWEYVGLS